jgi:hypothetical protein
MHVADNPFNSDSKSSRPAQTRRFAPARAAGSASRKQAKKQCAMFWRAATDLQRSLVLYSIASFFLVIEGERLHRQSEIRLIF